MCYLPTFFMGAFNILIIFTLNSSSENYSVWVISALGCNDCFFSSDFMYVFFLLKFKEIRTEINKILVWEFILIWLDVGLHQYLL